MIITVVLAALIGVRPSPAQAPDPKSGTSAQQPQEASSPLDLSELIAYRFRLGSVDIGYSLMAINKTDQPGRFLYRGLTPETESRPRSIQPTLIEPGQTLRIQSADLAWPDFQCVYVEASRRVELRLVRDGESDGLAIPLTRREKLYDVVSEQRLSEIEFRDFDEAVTLLGAASAAPLVLKAHENLRVAAARLAEKVRTDETKIFLAIPLKSSSRGSTN